MWNKNTKSHIIINKTYYVICLILICLFML